MSRNITDRRASRTWSTFSLHALLAESRPLVRITNVTRFEVGYSARSAADLRARAPAAACLGDAAGVPHPAIENRPSRSSPG